MGINQAFEALLGMSSREVSGLDIFHCWGAKIRSLSREVLQACLAEDLRLEFTTA